MPTADFDITNWGSIFMIHPLTPEARDWAEENLPDDFTGAVEPRYVKDIVEGFTADGLAWQ